MKTTLKLSGIGVALITVGVVIRAKHKNNQALKALNEASIKVMESIPPIPRI